MIISNEQLIANDGVILCPQCLRQDRLPVPKPRVAPRSDKPNGTSTAKRKNISFDDTPTPPKRQPSNSNKGQQHAAPSNQHKEHHAPDKSDTPKKTPEKKKTPAKNKPESTPVSGWGCLLWSVIITLILFAAYVFFGLVLQALQ